MIIIPMVGKSSRFFSAGYTEPKYQLNINGESVFSLAVKSFSKYFESEAFLFIVRPDYDALGFVELELERLKVKNYRIHILNEETMGQAETVHLGMKGIDEDESIYIFNIDTFRYGFSKPDVARDCDGYLEVFKGKGDHWSFIQVDDNERVLKTTEKERISDLCSDGLYYFKRKSDFDRAYLSAKASNDTVKGEYYIAPLYNQLIKEGLLIGYDLIDSKEIGFCGTPSEYELLLEECS